MASPNNFNTKRSLTNGKPRRSRRLKLPKPEVTKEAAEVAVTILKN